ncbi:metallophosphoesterase [Bacteroidales bacterium OttesenSCG-928-I14]|nr:metallophosphoesterase [Bacteroidales bacterium OttesenSCG-928-I14]
MNPFFIIVLLFDIAVNSYIFYRGWQALPDSLPLKICYTLVFIVFFASFLVAMGGRNILPLSLLKPLYFIGTTWLAVMLYITFYFLFTDLIHLFNHWFHFLPSKLSPMLFHQIQVISGYSLVAILLLVGNLRFNHPAIVEKDINIEKAGGNHRQLKVLAFSDIHLGVAVDKKRLNRYVDFINEQKPDIIFIAGDVVDNNIRPLLEENMHEELNRLEAPLGIYACFGNHEYISGAEECSKFFDKTQINMLIDRAVQVDDSFWVIGRDDRMNENRAPLNELVSKTDMSQPLFLLDHQPYHLEEAEESKIDLQVSGHTHNGQMWPLNLIVNKIFELGYGYKQKGSSHFYVSSGLALWGPEFRIGSQSEIVIFNINFK